MIGDISNNGGGSASADHDHGRAVHRPGQVAEKSFQTDERSGG